MSNLPGFRKVSVPGIQHASEMTGNFWDSDITVPSGHHLTQEEGIPATQITNASWISKSSQMIGDFWDADVVVPNGHTLTNEDGIPGEQITSGYISPTHIHNLSAGKINSGTLNIGRIPDLSALYVPLTNGAIENIPYSYSNDSTKIEIRSFTGTIDIMRITSLVPHFGGLYTRYYGYGFQVTDDATSSVYFESGTISSPENTKVELEDIRNQKKYTIHPSGVTQT